MKLKMQLAAAALAVGALSTSANATDFSGGIHKSDYKWMTFNLMHSEDNRLPFQNKKDTYLEMEFGGRSGIVDMYGYVDFFDVLNSSSDSLHNGDNFFAKLAPRFSLDAMTGKDLSFGPVKELYIATVTNIGDHGAFGGLWEHYIGLGSDVQVPWFGKMGLNLYARYVRENFGGKDEKKWDGYMLSTNWFKPVKTFADGSFISYQGYLDYKFGANEVGSQPGRSKTSTEWFNGIYYHTDRYAIGYGLKYYNQMAFFTDASDLTGVRQDTTGFGHYFSINYKF
ncbi:outer membrane protein OmpK [Gallaecimonas kandeliae]|uniref:outer membrane protein OmpK n=1 Tax=Gallaecimonas kandeliae TaxID=3029055 RepID=UPI002647982C|nr:outer membrane protein OmpK [Gallaecimonas kandeliae]WKE64934.1 outer membrane protein OmpK [Gallaecimonas kandeliae]